MGCWGVLGVEPRSDKKTIKIAYAKLLKQTRPDQDPEGFQRLHNAYKEALSWEDYYHEEDNTSFDEASSTGDNLELEVTLAGVTPENSSSEGVSQLEVTLPISSNQNAEVVSETELVESTLPLLPVDVFEEEPVKVLSKEDLQLLEDIRVQERALSDSWELFRQQVNTLVEDAKACNKVANWSFLEEMPAMRDLEFRKSAADSLFEVVSELNEESLSKKSLYIKRPVINHLNSLFNWDKHWQEYEYRYSSSMLEAVFPYLEETEKVVKGTKLTRELYVFRRFAAFAIDVAILLGVGFLIYKFGSYAEATAEEDGFFWALCWTLFYTLILVPIQESSRYQATLGKRFMRLQVINNQGGRISFFHAFGRTLATLLCCSLIKFIVWINMAMSWWKNELLQDTLSRSHVTMRPEWD